MACRVKRNRRLKILLLLAAYELELEEFEYFATINMPRKHRFHVRRIYLERKQKGEFHLLVQQARHFDSEIFFQMFRMSAGQFEEILQFISPMIEKDSLRREVIKPKERLSVTLRYIVTGDAFKTIDASYRISSASVSRIVKETCNVLWTVLKNKGFIKVPETSKEWNGFSKLLRCH